MILLDFVVLKIRKINFNMNYTEYATNIKIDYFYLLRQRQNLRPRIFQVKKILNDTVIGIVEFKTEEEVYKKNLLVLNHKSRLYKFMMRMSIFKNDSSFKKALYKMKQSSQNKDLEFIIKEQEYQIRKYRKEKRNIPELQQYIKGKYDNKIWIFDSTITQEEFEKAYAEYVLNDEKYIPDTEKNSANIIVPRTKEINMYSLYKTISRNGGMENVTNEQKWKSLFFQLMRKTNVSYTVRTFYKRFLYEFEQHRREKLRIDCKCKEVCDCDDYVNTSNNLINCAYNFDYKFEIGEMIVLYTYKEKYFGHVKLRRNRGINQYYIQFLGWCKEYSEWLCEDVLGKSMKRRDFHIAKKPSRSSKSNNLVNDPLIREKHSHNKLDTNIEKERFLNEPINFMKNQTNFFLKKNDSFTNSTNRRSPNTEHSNNHPHKKFYIKFDEHMNKRSFEQNNSNRQLINYHQDLNKQKTDMTNRFDHNFHSPPQNNFSERNQMHNYNGRQRTNKLPSSEYYHRQRQNCDFPLKGGENRMERYKNGLKIDFFKNLPVENAQKKVKNVFLHEEVVKFVEEEAKIFNQLPKNRTKKDFLKEYYGIEGDNECIMNIHNYMIISYYKELR